MWYRGNSGSSSASGGFSVRHGGMHHVLDCPAQHILDAVAIVRPLAVFLVRALVAGVPRAMVRQAKNDVDTSR